MNPQKPVLLPPHSIHSRLFSQTSQIQVKFCSCAGPWGREGGWIVEMGGGGARAQTHTAQQALGGGCKRAGATGTSRLCEAPGGPCFSEKPRTESPERLEGRSRGRGPRWCPPSLPLSLTLEREEAWGSVEGSQTSGPGKSSTDACTQGGIGMWRKGKGSEGTED